MMKKSYKNRFMGMALLVVAGLLVCLAPGKDNGAIVPLLMGAMLIKG